MTPLANLFYRRLLLVADDYGRYYASRINVRAACWPTDPESVTDEEVKGWMEECAANPKPLIIIYTVEGCRYLEITNFGQQKRSKSKFPEPPHHRETVHKSGAEKSDINPLSGREKNDRPSRSFVVEDEGGGEDEGVNPLPPNPSDPPPRPIAVPTQILKPPGPVWTLDETFTPAVDIARRFWPDSIDEDFTEAHKRWEKLLPTDKMLATHNLRGKQESEPGAGQFVCRSFARYMAGTEWKRKPRPAPPQRKRETKADRMTRTAIEEMRKHS